MNGKHYKVFVSSTLGDLKDERRSVMSAILDGGNFPVGMEAFPAANVKQFELIKRIIDECDYYVVISAGKYGSIGPGDKSYTQLEYEYAVARGIPVLGFVHGAIDRLPLNQCETKAATKRKLEQFHELIKQKMCAMWEEPGELTRRVITSLNRAIAEEPRPGWVRGGYNFGSYTRADAAIPGWTQACERLEPGDNPWVESRGGFLLTRPSISPTAYYLWRDQPVLAPVEIRLNVTFLVTALPEPGLPDFRVALLSNSAKTTYFSASHVLCIAPWEGGADRFDTVVRPGGVGTRPNARSRIVSRDREYEYIVKVDETGVLLSVDGMDVLRATFEGIGIPASFAVTTPWYWGLSTVGGSLRVSDITVT